MASVRAFAFRGGRPVPVPVQVDERDQAKKRIAIVGPAPIVDESPGSFDPSDQVVLLNRDLGERAAASAMPAGAAGWTEVRVGRSESPLGHVYLASFDRPPASPARDDCRYDGKADQVFAERYSVTFGGRPLPSHLGFSERVGDPGREVLNGVRARGDVRILRGLFHIERTEKDIDVQIHGTRDGAVRCVRTAKYSIRLPLGFKARGRVDLLFYRDLVEGRGKVNIKIPPRLVPASGDLSALFDFRGLEGARLLAPVGEPGGPVDGRLEESERRLLEGNSRWAALLLPDGTTFLLVVRLAGSLARLDQRIHYADEPAGTGQPSFGFRLSGAERLDTGEQMLSVLAALLETNEPAEVRRAASVLVSPPPVAASRLR